MINTTLQRLYLMQLGTMTLPLAAGRTLAMSNGCYLVQTSDGKNILIDSGLPVDYTPFPGTPPAENKKNVLEHLASLGLHPEDISLLICSHFDVDHAGYHDTFAHAEHIVQRAHYELARSGYARFAGARAHWDQPTLRYRLVEGDTLRYHDETKAFVDEAVKLLRGLKIAEFGRLLHDAWEVKKAFSPYIAPPIVDDIYALARQHGAWGGKITGAGGGGFMVFACPFDRRLELERVLNEAGVQMRNFSFTTQGVHAWSVEA